MRQAYAELAARLEDTDWGREYGFAKTPVVPGRHTA
jgi:hypothetical protein